MRKNDERLPLIFEGRAMVKSIEFVIPFDETELCVQIDIVGSVASVKSFFPFPPQNKNVIGRVYGIITKCIMSECNMDGIKTIRVLTSGDKVVSLANIFMQKLCLDFNKEIIFQIE